MSASPTMSEQILTAAEQVRAAGAGKPRPGRDPVNQPMIHNWVEAIGDRNPIYVDSDAAIAAGHPGIVAPPAMAQVWTMRGLHPQVGNDDDPGGAMSDILNAAGFTSVVATNCDQTYHRYLESGEQVAIEAVLEDVVGPKKTALGEGWFYTTRNIWKVAKEDGTSEVVAEMMFRILKFAPPAPAADDASPADLDPTTMLRPTPSRDTQFFWDGVAAHELRIQQRADGSLQHPPVPALWKDPSESTDYRVSTGQGTVFSYVVHHAPKVPGRSLPFVVALVELTEGVRMLGELRGLDPTEVHIGMPVEVEFLEFAGDAEADSPLAQPWTLYAWRPTSQSQT